MRRIFVCCFEEWNRFTTVHAWEHNIVWTSSQQEQRDDAYLDFTQRANSAMTMNSRKNTPQAESSHQPQKCFVKAQQQLKLHSTFPYHQIGISGQKVNDLRKFLIHLLLRFWFKAVELVAWFFSGCHFFCDYHLNCMLCHVLDFLIGEYAGKMKRTLHLRLFSV